MRVIGSILLAAAAGAGTFAAWGMFTDSGRRNFDEMAGIIPFAAGLVSLVMLVAGAIVMALWVRRARQRRGLAVGPSKGTGG
jgi:hypothetical protein